jgi:hypothetical protein
MTFDKQKYLDKCLKKLESDLEKLEQLRDEGPELKQIVDQCLEWHEEQNLILYRAFNNSCGPSGNLHFIGNLHCFLVNTILDDSAFKIVLDKEPSIEWANDIDEISCTDPKEILKIFDWYKEKDIKRKTDEVEILRLLRELRIK